MGMISKHGNNNAVVHVYLSHREANFCVHWPSLTPFFTILPYKQTRLPDEIFFVKISLQLDTEIAHSFFLVLNRMSPNARDTEMSPQILPFTIYTQQTRITSFY